MNPSEMDPAVEAMRALAGPGHTIPDAADHIPNAPGLYAVHTESAIWRMLGLEERDPEIPLYVGKSEDDLVTRDLKTHFAIERGPPSAEDALFDFDKGELQFCRLRPHRDRQMLLHPVGQPVVCITLESVIGKVARFRFIAGHSV